MGKLTSEMKNALDQSTLFPLATSSSSGIPNVIPVKFIFTESDNELWLVDNFMKKTLSNMKQNAHAALYVYIADKGICFQIKGEVNIYTSGKNYERMKNTVHKINPQAPARSLVILHITEIYQCAPGDNVGERLD